MWKKFIFQLKQFRKPFPEIDSWAFRFSIWRFSRSKSIWKFIKEEIDYAGVSITEELDIPTYLRNGDPIPPGIAVIIPGTEPDVDTSVTEEWRDF